MASVKQRKVTLYLDIDVDQALRASAAAANRSATKQLNLLLRNALSMNAAGNQSAGVVAMTGRGTLKAQAKPDPKIKAPRRSSR